MSSDKRKLPADEPALTDIAHAFRDGQAAAYARRSGATSYRAAARFWQAALTPGALDARMKELILVALHASATALDSEAVRRHVGRALDAGAKPEEVIDVLITIVGLANHALYMALPVLVRELQALGHPDAELPAMDAQAQAIKDAFIQARGFWNEQRDIIARVMPEYFSALSEISTDTWKNGALSMKERELVCIAIDCSVTHMYEPGLAIHIRNALKHGATRAEILEVFSLASVTGLEGYLMGVEALADRASPRP